MENAIYFAAICWGSSIRASQSYKLHKLMKTAGSEDDLPMFWVFLISGLPFYLQFTSCPLACSLYFVEFSSSLISVYFISPLVHTRSSVANCLHWFPSHHYSLCVYTPGYSVTHCQMISCGFLSYSRVFPETLGLLLVYFQLFINKSSRPSVGYPLSSLLYALGSTYSTYLNTKCFQLKVSLALLQQ